MNENKCVHGVAIYRTCKTCEKEMMIDYIVHNLETFTVDEATQAIREGVLTVGELNAGIEWRIRHE